jgi:hypothetical protein
MTTTAAHFDERFGQDLTPFVHPIDSVKRHPQNPRKHNIPAIQESLHEHGQQSPLVVQQSTGFIVKGNGTHEAAEKLGWKNIAYRVEDMDDERALRYLYADNRASDLASYDAKRTLEGLQALADGPGLAGTLWDQDALEDLELQVNGATVVDPGTFAGNFADADDPTAGERKAGDRAKGTKMKEVPIVMTVDEHALFMTRLRSISAALGTTGNIATIIASVEYAFNALAGQPKALPAASAAAAKHELLRDLITWYDDNAAMALTGADVAAKLLEVDNQFRDKPAAPKELPGQMHVEDAIAPVAAEPATTDPLLADPAGHVERITETARQAADITIAQLDSGGTVEEARQAVADAPTVEVPAMQAPDVADNPDAAGEAEPDVPTVPDVPHADDPDEEDLEAAYAAWREAERPTATEDDNPPMTTVGA